MVPLLRTYPSLKVWVAGCATGEEVFSLAILLQEEGLLERTMIYATDINPVVLEKARQGIFPIAAVRQHTANYQAAGGKRAFSDYYSAAYNAARFDPDLVRNVTFADHSLATDTVFSETHFISCRNVLIYFNKALAEPRVRAVPRVAVPPRLPGPGQQGEPGLLAASPTSSSRCASANASSARPEQLILDAEAVAAAADRAASRRS